MPKDQYFLSRLLELRPEIDHSPKGVNSIFAPQKDIETAKDMIRKAGDDPAMIEIGIGCLISTIISQYYLVPKDQQDD